MIRDEEQQTKEAEEETWHILQGPQTDDKDSPSD